ncbi:ABC transporter ATP-binding protein [Bacillus nitroreducens]
MDILKINGVFKKINNQNLLENITLNVKKGEIFGLLGPNGAGKTTLLKMLVGLYKVSKGTILINDIDISINREKALMKIGALIESPDMYEHMTGFANLKAVARLHHHIKDSTINEIVEFVNLNDAIHSKVKTYSLGMKQRLGIARAMLHNPDILILDEPTNGLDPQGIYELRVQLKKMVEEGKTVIISSHLISEMQLLCDRVAIIQDGSLVKILDVHHLNNIDDSISATYRFIDSSSFEMAIPLFTTISMVDKTNHLIKAEFKKLQEITQQNRIFFENEVAFIELNLNKKDLEQTFFAAIERGAS